MRERTIPTLEEIASNVTLLSSSDRRSLQLLGIATAELADVLIVHRRRLDALEVVRSGDGAVPHLPGSWCEHGFRREDDPQWRSGMAQCARCAGGGSAEPDCEACAIVVADYAQRAEAAERERDEMRVLRDESAALVAEYREWREEAEAERDAARADVERLRAYAQHYDDCDGWKSSRAYDFPCTCGLADALKETPA